MKREKSREEKVVETLNMIRLILIDSELSIHSVFSWGELKALDHVTGETIELGDSFGKKGDKK